MEKLSICCVGGLLVIKATHSSIIINVLSLHSSGWEGKSVKRLCIMDEEPIANMKELFYFCKTNKMLRKCSGSITGTHLNASLKVPVVFLCTHILDSISTSVIQIFYLGLFMRLTWGPTTPGGPGGPVLPWNPCALQKQKHNCHTDCLENSKRTEWLDQLLTVSPLCPGCPGNPSFPAGPWQTHKYLNMQYWYSTQRITKTYYVETGVVYEFGLTGGPFGPGKPVGPCGPGRPWSKQQTSADQQLFLWKRIHNPGSNE